MIFPVKQKINSLIAAATLIGCTGGAIAQDFDNVKKKDTPLRGSVHMFKGAGGNIGVSAGEDGILIIDDQFAPLAEKIAAALKELGNDAPKYLVNTHFHGDHTGANVFFHDHKDSTIFAHENVRVRLASDEKVAPGALPVVTFADGITIHFNNETLNVFHLEHGHTDGDSVVWFKEPNVMHTGDLFFNKRFPFIDLSSGGSVDGYVAAVKTLLGKIDDDTIIIPGHGPLADKADYENFLAMIEETRSTVEKMKADGLTQEQAIEKGLGSQWDSWSWNFISTEKWIKTLW